MCQNPSRFEILNISTTSESCIDLLLHTFKNVVMRKRERENEYFSPASATEKRPRDLVSLQPHASTAHLFMEVEEEEESKGQV